MPRKVPRDVLQVINILKFRGALQDFDLEKIDNVNENMVTEILQRALFFLSFSDREGCSLPPLEAMSCGCVVIGGKEYFNEEFSCPIESTDVLTFAKTVERVIHAYRNNCDSILEKGEKLLNMSQNIYIKKRRRYCQILEGINLLNYTLNIIINSYEEIVVNDDSKI